MNDYQDILAALRAKNSQSGMASGPGQTVGATFGPQQMPIGQQTPQPSAMNAGMNGLAQYLKAGAGKASGFGQLGSTTPGGLGGMLGGTPATAGAGGGAGLGAAGMLGGLAAAGYLGDKEMNENSNSPINADKLNDMGTVGGIGLRGGDLANGFNPATWLSDPKKAGKGLANAFTFGLFDKLM